MSGGTRSRPPGAWPATLQTPDGPGGLSAVLAAEHAAVFAYGAVGAWVDGDEADLARESEQAHRARRDALLVTLTDRGVPAPPAEPAYELPFPVADADDAQELATLVEERVAAVWRAALPQAATEDRADVLTGLIDAAVRATRWRAAAGVEPASVPFPGTP